METPILSIVGQSGSGKTTLLEKLIPELKRRGLCIGVVKHHPHPGVSVDVEGKDTWRLAQAGADHVALVALDLVMHRRRTEREPSLAEVVAEIRGVDLILTEGFKQEHAPKVQVSRGENPPNPVCDPGELVAVVSDYPPKHDVPWFDLEDVSGLADLIVERFIRTASSPARSGGCSPTEAGHPIVVAGAEVEASAHQVERWFRLLKEHPERYRFDTHGGFTFTRGRFGEVGAHFQTRERFYGLKLRLTFQLTAVGETGFRFRLLRPRLPIWGRFRIEPAPAGRSRLWLEIGGASWMGRLLLRLPPIRGTVLRQIQAEVTHIKRSAEALPAIEVTPPPRGNPGSSA